MKLFYTLCVIKTQISNLVYMTLFWNNLNQVQYQNDGKPNNLKLFGSNKAKGPKQDIYNILKLLMSEGGEPWL